MRVYTKATERLKEMHRNYKGAKSGDWSTANWFDNADATDFEGVFTAIKGTSDDYYISRGYKLVSQQEFIDIIENKLPTIDKSEQITGSPSDKGKPEHYAKGIDTFQRMEANCTIEECLAFVRGNIDKYNWREKGQDLEDFDKIIAYANWGKTLKDKQMNQELK